MDFNEAQKLFVEYSKRNFGDCEENTYRTLLGVMEELGELAHAHLKGEQGIRHTPEEIAQMKKDAVGDIIGFLSNYCEYQGLLLGDCVDHAWNEIKDRDFKNHKLTGNRQSEPNLSANPDELPATGGDVSGKP